MKRVALLVALVLAGCGGESAARPDKSPVSVRGWIADVEGSNPEGSFRTVETESARRIAMFQQTSTWIENAEFVSGGVAETGAFILLDVPPGNVTISFNAPNAETAKLVLENVPPSADVFIPGLVLKKDGSDVEDPKAIQVRVAASIDKPRPMNIVAKIDGHPVTVIETPYDAMMNRREYPDVPAGYIPLAKVK
jgi:hypothetical protein